MLSDLLSRAGWLASPDDADVQRLVGAETRVFPTSFYAGRPFYATLLACATLSLALLAASRGRAALLAGGCCAAVASAVVLLLWRARLLRPAYETSVALGRWPFGVLCFTRGDIAVKLPGLLRHTECSIEVAYLVVAEPVTLFPCRRMLRIRYVTVDAKPCVLDVPARRLRDTPETIALYINELRSANATPAGSYSLPAL
jgi:hypothetical protein